METWYDPFTASFEKDPYPLYRRLRNEHPVYRYEDGTNEVWIVSRYDDVASILGDWRTFSSIDTEFHHRSSTVPRNTEANRQLITTDPPVHDRIRQAVKGRFAPKAIQLLEERISTEIRSIVDALAGSATVDAARDVAWALTLTIISELLGVPDADRLRVLHLYQQMAYSEDETSAREGALGYNEYFESLAAERLARPREDVISELMRGTRDGSVSSAEAVVLVKDLFEGGVDVPANLCGNALAALAARPDQQRRLAAVGNDPASVRAGVEELARYDAPIQCIPRRAAADAELHGAEIPAGSAILLVLGSANRDERRFSEPDQLDVGRAPSRNLAFGSGVHFCIGAPLARLELAIMLPVLLRAFPDLELEAEVQRPRGDYVMRAVLNLPVSSSLASPPVP